MHHDPKTGKIVKKGRVSTPVDEDQVEHELDEALAETCLLYTSDAADE